MRILLAAILAAFALSAQAAPLEAYARLRALDRVNLSPDGSRLAYLRRQGDTQTVLIEEADGAKPLGGFNIRAQTFKGLGWAGPNHIWVASTGTPRNQGSVQYRGEFPQLQIYDISANAFTEALKDHLSLNLEYPEYRVVDGRPTLYVRAVTFSHDFLVSLFRIDVATGETQAVDKIRSESGDDPRWMVDAAGRLATRTQYNAKTGEWTLMLPDSAGAWRIAGRLTDPVRRPGLTAFGFEPGTALGRRMEGDQPVFRKVSLLDGTWGEVVPIAPDLRGWISDDATQLTVGMTEGYETLRTRFVDPKEQAAWDRVVRAFKGDSVTLRSWSDDRKRLVAYVFGPATGVAYVLLRDKGAAEVLGPAHEGLGPDDIAQPRWITYKAADGLDITGILTLPKGRDAKGLPLVVLPHDGPQDRDIVEFHWLAQGLASRGYAVFQPNYRGSGGFGPDFVHAGYGEWGRKMQSDVSDGVRHLVAEGVVDPARVCVVGRGGYAGYVALAGVTLEQGIYRCGVSVAGISDVNGMMAWRRSRTSASDGDAMRLFRLFVGVERGEQAPLDAISPAKLAAKASAPVLLIHSRDDSVVPYDQSRRMAKAVEATGRKVEFITLPDEDHWLARGETRLKILSATVDFLERHNPPK